MKYRILEQIDTQKFKEDIFKCFKDNRTLFFDELNPHAVEDNNLAAYYLSTFIDTPDDMVMGVFDNNEEYLYGIIIFQEIRMGVKTSAKVHCLLSKTLWGKKAKTLCKSIINESIFNVLYCEIPGYAYRTIAFAKSLGFRKTGYIPRVVPYTALNKAGVMHDIFVFTLERDVNFPGKAREE